MFRKVIEKAEPGGHTGQKTKGAMKMTNKQEIMKEITKFLGLETLKTQDSDELDFPTISIWRLRNALEMAYEAGAQHAEEEAQ
jgi:hypothetical protein